MRVPFAPMNTLLAPVCVLTLALAAAAQTGRTMSLLAPVIPGATAVFAMDYPASATGNFYGFLWSSPSYGGVTPISVPGLTVHGPARVNPSNCVSTFSGFLGASGQVTHSLVVPTHPSYLGYQWDLQAADLDFTTNSLYFADNELQLSIGTDL